MPKVGEIDVYTPSGWVTLDLYGVGDFQFDPVEIRTPDGWATPFLTDPDSADTPIEVYTESEGWRGINTVGYQIIDSFEDGNLDEYVVSTAGQFNPTSARAAFHGNYGLEAQPDNFELVISKPTFDPSLPYYPHRGDQFEIYTRGRDSTFANGARSKIGWAMADVGNPDTDGFTSRDVREHYAVTLVSDVGIPNDNQFNLFYEDEFNDENPIVSLPMNEWQDNLWYKVVVDFGYTVTDDITATCYDRDNPSGEWAITQNENGTDLQLSFTETTRDDGGIVLDAEGDTIHWDWERKTAPL